jgi:ankyrin repeat protein
MILLGFRNPSETSRPIKMTWAQTPSRRQFIGALERRIPFAILRFNFGTAIKQCPRKLNVASPSRHVQRSRPGDAGLTIAAIDNRGAHVRELLSRGADVNHLDTFGMTALHYAASIDYGETQMIEMLLQSGADTKRRTKHGLTALGLAKKYGHGDMQRLLKRAVAGE